MNAAKILIALGLLVAACSGQAPALQANVTATPLPVPTAVVPSVIVDLSMECNYILALSTFVGTDSKLAAISDRNLFQELGEKPSLLRDEAFVNEAATIAEAKLAYLIEKSKKPGPECVAEFRAHQLEAFKLELYFWQLIKAGNLEEAGKVDDQIIARYERMATISQELVDAMNKSNPP